MGVFNTCAFVGGILANFLAVWILTSAGWQYVFPICSIFVAVMGVAVFFFCHEKTKANEIDESKESKESKDVEDNVKLIESSSPPEVTLSWRDLWSKPGFADICICMLCLKVTRYFVYMWLPYLYTKEFGYTEASAGSASTGFEMGGVFGSVLIGMS